MPVFEYKALDMRGKNTSGIIDADSSAAARQKLRGSRIFPVSLKEVQAVPHRKETRSMPLGGFFDRIRPVEISMMTRQLATLVGAGFPLVSAIDSLIPPTKSHALKKRLVQIKDAIVEGNSFAAALSLSPGLFTPLYINMVRAGESSGTLEIVLDRLADITEKQQTLNNRIKSALAYPILMAIFGAVVLFLLLTFIVPSITRIFADMNQTLPLPTIILIAISGLFKSYWWGLLILAAAFLVLLRTMKRSRKGGFLLDRIKLTFPIVGILVRKLAIARFARTLASLLENGVSMLAALDIVKNIVGNRLIADAVEEASREVGKGQALGVSLAEKEIFPPLSIQMIQVGEQSGGLEAMLNKVADIYENEVESSVLSLTSLLEPIMILVMGVIVGFIVLSICLPIFEMNQLVR